MISKQMAMSLGWTFGPGQVIMQPQAVTLSNLAGNKGTAWTATLLGRHPSSTVVATTAWGATIPVDVNSQLSFTFANVGNHTVTVREYLYGFTRVSTFIVTIANAPAQTILPVGARIIVGGDSIEQNGMFGDLPSGGGGAGRGLGIWSLGKSTFKTAQTLNPRFRYDQWPDATRGIQYQDPVALTGPAATPYPWTNGSMRGWQGATTRGMINDFANQIALNPQGYVDASGINNFGTASADKKELMEKWRVARPSMPYVVCTMRPTGSGQEGPKPKATIQAQNALIRAWVQAKRDAGDVNVYLLDLYALLDSGDGWLRATDHVDGLHLSVMGATRCSNGVNAVMNLFVAAGNVLTGLNWALSRLPAARTNFTATPVTSSTPANVTGQCNGWDVRLSNSTKYGTQVVVSHASNEYGGNDLILDITPGDTVGTDIVDIRNSGGSGVTDAGTWSSQQWGRTVVEYEESGSSLHGLVSVTWASSPFDANYQSLGMSPSGEFPVPQPLGTRRYTACEAIPAKASATGFYAGCNFYVASGGDRTPFRIRIKRIGVFVTTDPRTEYV
ncbi:hypothetical protein [Caulobacter phage DCM]|uniref:Uncharacterized protein n=2 Tax=Autonotataviridae TaxID=3424634 RepID=A0AAE9WZF2_9CAUD|nr:hypothetical protein [Caulobacter phage DCM]WCA46302.1 hypothetical protein [Caulobacter phage ERS]WCD56134.1 hypothetical protein [Caulobacter phage BL199]